jgi:hypothetical protein
MRGSGRVMINGYLGIYGTRPSYSTARLYILRRIYNRPMPFPTVVYISLERWTKTQMQSIKQKLPLIHPRLLYRLGHDTHNPL